VLGSGMLPRPLGEIRQQPMLQVLAGNISRSCGGCVRDSEKRAVQGGLFPTGHPAPGQGERGGGWSREPAKTIGMLLVSE
jgi:hypothetical protein